MTTSSSTVKRAVDYQGTDIATLKDNSTGYEAQAVAFVDETMTPYGIAHVDNKPRVVSTPYLFEISEGVISGHNGLHKFGANENIGATEETVWTNSTAYTYLAAATQLKISSSSTADASGGTGARTVTIYGLDASYSEINETITLTGQTEVLSVNSYLRIFRMMVRTAGTGGKNAGVIYAGTGTVTVGVPAAIYARVEVGVNQTQMALWTVPAGNTFYMTEIFAGEHNNKRTMIRLYVRPENEVFQLKEEIPVVNNTSFRTYALPLKFAAKTDIELRAMGDVTGGDVVASFDGWYET